MTLLKKPRSSTAVAKQITLKGVDVTLSITRGKIAIDKYYARVRQGEFIRWIPRFDEDFIIDFRRYDNEDLPANHGHVSPFFWKRTQGRAVLLPHLALFRGKYQYRITVLAKVPITLDPEVMVDPPPKP